MGCKTTLHSTHIDNCQIICWHFCLKVSGFLFYSGFLNHSRTNQTLSPLDTSKCSSHYINKCLMTKISVQVWASNRSQSTKIHHVIHLPLVLIKTITSVVLVKPILLSIKFQYHATIKITGTLAYTNIYKTITLTIIYHAPNKNISTGVCYRTMILLSIITETCSSIIILTPTIRYYRLNIQRCCQNTSHIKNKNIYLPKYTSNQK